MPEKKNHPWLAQYPKDICWHQVIPSFPLYSLLDESVKKYPSRPFIYFLGKKYSYKEIGELVNKTAKGLQSFGIEKNSRIGLFMPNTPYYIIFYFAILKIGGIVVNFNPLYSKEEIKKQILDSEVEIMVTLNLKEIFDKIYNHFEEKSLKKMIICPLQLILPWHKSILFSIFKEKEQAVIPVNNQIIGFKTLIQNDGLYKPLKIIPEKDIAVIQYTGGTTGIPKGAMLSHANIYSNTYQCYYWFKSVAKPGYEKSLAALPFFHIFAMTAVMNLTIIVGGEIVIMFPRFNVEEAIKLLVRHKITFFPAVPTIYSMINNHKNAYKLGTKNLKACISGGAPLPIEIKKKFESLTGALLIEGYGLSETSPVIAANPLQSENKLGSIGIPLPSTCIKIMSLEDNTQEMPLGEKGEIAVKGPQVMIGYWHDHQKKTGILYQNYFYTGDVGYMDDQGYTFLVDRLKDMIIVNGYNVYPRIIEEAIYRHKAVEEVTVIGAPDLKRGEIVKAFVKLKKDFLLTSAELYNFLQDKLSPIETPRQIEFRDTLPKTLIGKLSKKELIAEEKAKLEIENVNFT